MYVHDKLDEIVAYLESARAMPMSSSAVVNRSELLARLDAVRAMLPGSLRAAEMVLDQREELEDQHLRQFAVQRRGLGRIERIELGDVLLPR